MARRPPAVQPVLPGFEEAAAEEWERHWRGMPAFDQEDLAPFDSEVYEFRDGRLYVHWASETDRRDYRALIREAKRAAGIPQERPVEDLGRPWLAGVIGQDLDIGKAHEDWTRTQSVWWPEAEIGRLAGKSFVSTTPRVPRFPIYLPTRGRYESRLTAKQLDLLGVPYFEVIEPQERDLYLRAGSREDRLLVLPARDRGLVFVRNWIWDYAAASGVPYFWTFDDNIMGFYRLQNNLKTPVGDGTIIWAVEEMATRYANVGIAGMNYFMVASRKTKMPPVYINSRVYSNMLLRTDYREDDGRPFRNDPRLRFNDDTDLNLRVLKRGDCTLLFNAFLIFKAPTMTVKGGMAYEQAALSAEEVARVAEMLKAGASRATIEAEVPGVAADHRWQASWQLKETHPVETTVVEKWGRWHHSVDYSRFRDNRLRLRENVVLPEGVDNFGMELRVQEPAPKVPAPKPTPPAPAPKPSVPFVFPDRPVGLLPRVQATFEVGASRAAIPADWKPDPFPDLSRVSGPIGFDTETSGLRWWDGARVSGTSLAWWEGSVLRSAYLPVRHRGVNHDPERFLEWARSAEGLRGRQLVGLNVKFDAHQERESGLDLEALGCRLSDVGHRQAIIDNRTRVFKLDAIAELLLGEGQGKVRGVDVSRGAHVYHAAEVAAYARRDAELPLLILAKQIPLIESDGLGRVVDLEDEVQWAVVEMERNGMLLDMERLTELQRRAKKEHEAALFKLAALAGFACNPSSADDMERLFRQRGIEVRERTEKTGRISLAEGSLDGIEDEAVSQARRCHILSGIRSRYLDAYPRLVSPNGIMRYSLHQLRGDEGGTISGRFSCSQAISGEEGANLQQVITAEKLHDQEIPEYDIRNLYVAPDGRLVVAGDAKQIEYRVFAHYTENPELLKAYKGEPNAPQLRQLRNAWEAEGVAPAEIERRAKALTVDFHEWVGATVRKYRPDFGRKRIKTVNFMVLFGGGIRKTCEMLGVSEKEGKALLAAYDSTFPDARRLGRLASQLAENRRYVSTYLGRRSRFGPNDRYHRALNAVVQGTAADYNKVKLAALYRARRDFDLTLRMTVHDEVVGDVPNVEAAHDLAAFLDRQEWPEFKVPILWSVGTGASWGEAK